MITPVESIEDLALHLALTGSSMKSPDPPARVMRAIQDLWILRQNKVLALLHMNSTRTQGTGLVEIEGGLIFPWTHYLQYVTELANGLAMYPILAASQQIHLCERKSSGASLTTTPISEFDHVRRIYRFASKDLVAIFPEQNTCCTHVESPKRYW